MGDRKGPSPCLVQAVVQHSHMGPGTVSSHCDVPPSSGAVHVGLKALQNAPVFSWGRVNIAIPISFLMALDPATQPSPGNHPILGTQNWGHRGGPNPGPQSKSPAVLCFPAELLVPLPLFWSITPLYSWGN